MEKISWVWEGFLIQRFNPVSPGSACLHRALRMTDENRGSRVKQVVKCLWVRFVF